LEDTRLERDCLKQLIAVEGCCTTDKEKTLWCAVSYGVDSHVEIKERTIAFGKEIRLWTGSNKEKGGDRGRSEKEQSGT